MQIKSNSLVKILVPTVLVIGGFIGIKSCSSTDNTAPDTPQNNALASLSPEELQALGGWRHVGRYPAHVGGHTQ
ncbi:integrating conjugative element protein [Xenorhabdus indica]|nr:integrating conjugative element protein [Xenorhabdus indica]